MHLSSSLLAATAILTTGAQALIAAHLSAASLTESTPWKLSNILAYETATPANETTNSTQPSSISFHFSDTNPGLQIETDCSRTVEAGGNLYDGEWYLCDNKTVRLAWALTSDKTIQIQKGWDDPECVSYPTQSLGQLLIALQSR